MDKEFVRNMALRRWAGPWKTPPTGGARCAGAFGRGGPTLRPGLRPSLAPPLRSLHPQLIAGPGPGADTLVTIRSACLLEQRQGVPASAEPSPACRGLRWCS